MRTGACTVQQALTAEAASVLKHSLSLARRRGHAQVTPLHVAATLLSSTISSSNLLRRACLKSQPHHPASHPLQCRALELCFNVALNRLPTNPPPSSGSLIHPLPSLSNALIAALKRAQAHQRRGCIEQQQQQNQQPLLPLKVELEQLIVSILDDPSVSRVMREAGFSSTCIKTNIEEDSSSSSVSLSPPSSSSSFFFHTHFLKHRFEPKDDLKVVFDAMLRKDGRRTNTVLVGDSVSTTEGLIFELKEKLERGQVPDELKLAHFISLQLSHVHLRLMSRGDVNMKISDLRKKISSLETEGRSGGVIIHAGDLRWAVDEESKDDYMVTEIGRLISELRGLKNRVWLVGTASYQTYTRCQMGQPSLEAQWALQAVVVPSGGLALSLQAHSGLDSRATKLNPYPFNMLESKPSTHMDEEEEDRLKCCPECTFNYEKEASALKSTSFLPSMNHKDSMPELRMKWNRLCQNLHHARRDQIRPYQPLFNQSLIGKYASSHPWWPTSLPQNPNNFLMGSRSISFTDSPAKPDVERSNHMAQISLKKDQNQEVKTTLSLGRALFSNSETSKDQQGVFYAIHRELSQRLKENIPWQLDAIPSIMEALLECRSCEKGTWISIQGTDRVGKRRLARLIAESLSSSNERLVEINATQSTSRTTLTESLRKDPKCVFMIEGIDRAGTNFAKTIADGFKNGYWEDQSRKEVSLVHGTFILINSNSRDSEEKFDNVMKMRLWVEENSSEISNNGTLKRKPECDSSPIETKKPRIRASALDLNIAAEEEEEEHGNSEVEDVLPGDLTQEADSGDLPLLQGLLDSISTHLALDTDPDQVHRVSDSLAAKLHRAFEETRGVEKGIGCLCVDREAVEGMVAGAGSFLESVLEKWVREVFQRSLLLTVRKGGNVRLSVEGREGNLSDCGFMGSLLPNRIHVD